MCVHHLLCNTNLSPQMSNKVAGPRSQTLSIASVCVSDEWSVVVESEYLRRTRPPFEQVTAWSVLFHLRAADSGISRGGENRMANFLLLPPPLCLFLHRDYSSVIFISCVRPELEAIFNLEGAFTLSTHTSWTMSRRLLLTRRSAPATAARALLSLPIQPTFS